MKLNFSECNSTNGGSILSVTNSREMFSLVLSIVHSDQVTARNSLVLSKKCDLETRMKRHIPGDVQTLYPVVAGSWAVEITVFFFITMVFITVAIT